MTAEKMIPFNAWSRRRIAEGRKVCIEAIQGLREIPGIAGVHIMAPLQKIDAIAYCIEESGVRKGR